MTLFPSDTTSAHVLKPLLQSWLPHRSRKWRKTPDFGGFEVWAWNWTLKNGQKWPKITKPLSNPKLGSMNYKQPEIQLKWSSSSLQARAFFFHTHFLGWGCIFWPILRPFWPPKMAKSDQKVQNLIFFWKYTRWTLRHPKHSPNRPLLTFERVTYHFFRCYPSKQQNFEKWAWNWTLKNGQKWPKMPKRVLNLKIWSMNYK